MPYLTSAERLDINKTVCLPFYGEGTHAGRINYIISTWLWIIFNNCPSYERANMIIGVLEAIKLEFYRRIVAPYEDQKLSENGDIV